MDFSEFVNYCSEHEKKLWLVFTDLDINKDGECMLKIIILQRFFLILRFACSLHLIIVNRYESKVNVS